ncbi:zinc finger protein ZAT12-like [Prunus avium]|uniref:Zinc finger protein ZAT12-like n=1 Tax=Prunus avium TaxID=42229 RepID=A0A6P5SD74_PRUAV|nr:zinc finger protein ZAT12-like [Prunus avium]
MTMKRSITEMRELDRSLTMANCLMLLSRGSHDHHHYDNFSVSPTRVFECKTCNRQFPSFQALGGHRASHKKPRLMGPGDGNSSNGSDQSQSQGSPPKPKTHECNICGLEFAIGQALGGHMRRHRSALSNNNNNNNSQYSDSNSNSLSLSPQPAPMFQVLKKTNSGRRVMCLDLNLTPLENDLKILQIGKAAPLVGFS